MSRIGILLGHFWHGFLVIVRCFFWWFWGEFRIILGCSWDSFGMISISVWTPSGEHLGFVWASFQHVLGFWFWWCGLIYEGYLLGAVLSKKAIKNTPLEWHPTKKTRDTKDGRHETKADAPEGHAQQMPFKHDTPDNDTRRTDTHDKTNKRACFTNFNVFYIHI